ncbi:MAG: hypothetical protein KDE32_00420 [Novosphingobium sp.]|nr:hypothetical protein [Novosphingobium sp.]
MRPEAVKYRLGTGPFATSLVFLMLAGSAGYFARAALVGEVEAIVVFGRRIAGAETAWWAMIAIAMLFGVSAIYLLVRSLQNIGREKYVALDPNRIVVSGLDLDGVLREVSYAEIDKLVDYRTRGIDGVEISLRNGSKLNFAAPQFHDTRTYRDFRSRLDGFLPVAHRR